MGPDPYAVAADAARVLADRTGVARHDALVVLGSGWAGAAIALGDVVAEVAVTDVPGFAAPAAPGHDGRLLSTVLDRGDGVEPLRVLVALGRTHLYEGKGPEPVVHTVRTAAATGARLVLLTNASGSLRADWGPGTGVLIADHLNLADATPLAGPRFVDLTEAYSPRLRAAAHAADPGLVEGVYAILRGPAFETVAEARMLVTLGADLVGMSTVPEVIAAREAGLEVLALSVVTTVEPLEPGAPGVDPDEVLRVAARAATGLGAVLARVLRTTPTSP